MLIQHLSVWRPQSLLDGLQKGRKVSLVLELFSIRKNEKQR